MPAKFILNTLFIIIATKNTVATKLNKLTPAKYPSLLTTKTIPAITRNRPQKTLSFFILSPHF